MIMRLRFLSVVQNEIDKNRQIQKFSWFLWFFKIHSKNLRRRVSHLFEYLSKFEHVFDHLVKLAAVPKNHLLWTCFFVLRIQNRKKKKSVIWFQVLATEGQRNFITCPRLISSRLGAVSSTGKETPKPRRVENGSLEKYEWLRTV